MTADDATAKEINTLSLTRKQAREEEGCCTGAEKRHIIADKDVRRMVADTNGKSISTKTMHRCRAN